METPIRVLMVEDSEDDALLLLRELRRSGYEPAYQRVDTPEAMKAALAAQAWDVITADYVLPRFSGLAALKAAQESGADAPFIIVSGKIGEETAVEAMKAGAQDYVMKTNLKRLGSVVARELEDAEMRRRRRQAEEALRESEERFRILTEASPAGVFYTDAGGNCRYVNERWCAIAGLAQQEALGMAWVDALHPDDRERVLEQWDRALKAGETFRAEYRFRNRAGKTAWVIGHAAALRHDGVVTAYIGTVTDITDRKEAEESLARTNRALKVLSACNEETIHATDELQLLQAMCRVIVQTGGYGMAWVGLVERDAQKTLRPVAWAGGAGDYPDGARFTWADTPWGRDPAGSSGRYPKARVCRDVHTGQTLGPWHAEAEKRGYRSFVSLPLCWADEVFGALCIYAAEPDAFAQGDPELLNDLANDLAFGIMSLRTRMERDLAVQEWQREQEKLRNSLEETIEVIASTVEMRDPYTAGHQHRVADLAAAIARELELSEEQIQGIRLAGTVHDLGKVYVPAEILNKPGPLSEAEFAIVRAHSRVGHEVLKKVDFPWPIAQMVLQHHERLNGSGYPHGIRDSEILTGARILAVADVVEAIVSHRPYRPALDLDHALAEIRSRRGILYDPGAVDACLRLFGEKGFAFAGGGPPPDRSSASPAKAG